MSRVSISFSTQEVAQLQKTNNDLIYNFLQLITAEKPLPRQCEHGSWDVKLNCSKKPNSQMINIGRWYSFCSSCKKWQWASERLDVDNLFRVEEFATLISIRNLLRTVPEVVPEVASEAPGAEPSISALGTIEPPERPPEQVHESTFRKSRKGKGKKMSSRISGFTFHQARRRQKSTTTSSAAHILSTTITLVFWTENFMDPVFIEIFRPAWGAFCLNDHEAYLGQFGVRQLDAYEIYDKQSCSWNGIQWGKYIFPGTESVLFLRRQGVTCMPRFSALL
ncbi:hypothetical protein NP233_g11888 [Leucocoprinus birnbaumii]|uniref:Uncharacterized protein n=1 Tax=Leucocoprinus birnbaumii TaxID=56174 RepID=A0AAD5VFN7_9AGAR|nr:hypothetical protein NP233_g11888 [Leucocoprinus birnbaumii]